MLAITEPTKLEGTTALAAAWYVARTQAGREHHVARKWLAAGAGDVQNTQLCRWAHRSKPSRRNTVKKYEAAYPGYIFVKLDAGSIDWDKVRRIRHYFGLLPLGRDAIAIDNRVVEALRLEEEIGTFDDTKPPMAGQKVQITDDHPFAGLVSEIRKAKRTRAKERTDRFIAIITTQLFGSVRDVTISGSKLRKVDES